MSGCKAFLTLDEALAAVMESDSDDEEEVDTIVMIPPDPSEVTDEELEIDSEQPGALPNDVSGILEVKAGSAARKRQENRPAKPKKPSKEGKSNDRNKKAATREGTNNYPVGNSRNDPKERKNWPKRKWGVSDTLFTEMQEAPIIPSLQDEHPELAMKSPLEIYKLFFDQQVEQLIIDHTLKYAREVHNDHEFDFQKEDLWKFLLIIMISSYNERPSYRLYWSKEEDVACPLISKLMPRHRYELIKRYIHVCDNNQLDMADRWTKLRPLVKIVNEKLKIFGIFRSHLSIDEQIIPYYGHHSCKMYHREKPIRFGFQFWVLAGDDGCPFHFEPYQGKLQTKDGIPLGTKVVNDLVQCIDHPEQHFLYFDNLFCSLPLLESLRERKIKATGTIRNNRLQNCQLTEIKAMEKTDRGTFETVSTSDLCVSRYHDNKVVTIASNFMSSEPAKDVLRRVKGQKEKIHVPQPAMICNYNGHMGGVDVLDGFLANLRPCIGGKKWYWMPLINCLRLLQVAAFRAYVALGHNKISQLEFLRSVVKMAISETTLSTPSRPGKRRASVLPRRLTEDHIPTPAEKQGRCSFCKKNTRMQCSLCDVLLHQNAVCFNGFHT